MKTDSEAMDKVKGVIERVVFHNEENGFAVLRIIPNGGKSIVTITGNSPILVAGEEIEATGSWHNDAKFGRQLRAEKLKTSDPVSLLGIEKFLGSGIIEGIGPVYAQRLVEKFGRNIFDIIENESARLETLPGIGRDRRIKIKDSWNRQKAVREIMLFLYSHGISTGKATKIFNQYREQSIFILKNDPYRLARDITGIGFKSADKIALDLGLPLDSPKRLLAGIEHTLQQATNNGHCALPPDELITRTNALLEVDIGMIEDCLDGVIENAELICDTIDGNDLIFLPRLHFAESAVAGMLKKLAATAPAYPPMNIESSLDWVEKQTEKTLGESQREAILMAAENRCLVITGGPGVGKTTILDSILRIFTAAKIRPVLCAPTGRAAKRLFESTGCEAKTIHRLLEIQPGKGFSRNTKHPLSGDLFIVDETSMVDLPLFCAFMSALPRNAHLLLVGDVDQLPSVGPGRVLGDIISSETVPVIRLTEIYRQLEDSKITVAAHDINAGKSPVFSSESDSDCLFIERKEPTEILATIERLISTRLPEGKKIDPFRDVQLLTPMHRGLLGTENFNSALQEILNPPNINRAELTRHGQTLRHGDKVIQTRNNYEKEIYNGDIGIVTHIEPDPVAVSVAFESGIKTTFNSDELEDLQLGYAITIHKSQGSEFPVVVIPMTTSHYIMLQRNLIYTALTRGKKMVILVGDRRALDIAIQKTDTNHRYGGLIHRLRS